MYMYFEHAVLTILVRPCFQANNFVIHEHFFSDLQGENNIIVDVVDTGCKIAR